jgi:hypothetical protein
MDTTKTKQIWKEHDDLLQAMEGLRAEHDSARQEHDDAR